ncbi:hypothetical protein EVAR_88075_1 [Eumeta japonica]|uniref:Uncharacterized protein n=1 Tax=Eumeta variegata TaxID=151549 RepID=A0A4C1WHB1_EUMVA|nr:hypothetical protein EVAR_88075_1 [Eumeta japonica]
MKVLRSRYRSAILKRLDRDIAWRRRGARSVTELKNGGRTADGGGRPAHAPSCTRQNNLRAWTRSPPLPPPRTPPSPHTAGSLALRHHAHKSERLPPRNFISGSKQTRP